MLSIQLCFYSHFLMLSGNFKIYFFPMAWIIWQTACHSSYPPRLRRIIFLKWRTSLSPLFPRNYWSQKILYPYHWIIFPYKKKKILNYPSTTNQRLTNVLEDQLAISTTSKSKSLSFIECLPETLFSSFYSMKFTLLSYTWPLAEMKLVAERFSCCKFMNKWSLLNLFWTYFCL